jgi:nucleoside-specific outer membrane channel protein Tsx
MIAQTLTTSFKAQLYEGVHNLPTDVIKIALYTAPANLGADTTIYSATDEVVAAGYTAGGNVMSGITVSTSGTVAFVGFTNAVWTSALTARGALIYNSSKANKSIAVLDFGADKTSATTFTVAMPANTSTTALIRSS